MNAPDPKPLKGVNLRVFNRLLELTAGGRADVEPQQLQTGYPGPDRPPTAVEVVGALAWLRTERYVTSLPLYGVGGAGVGLFEARLASEQAREAELEAAQQTEAAAGEAAA